MLISRNLHKKSGHLQPHFYSKARADDLSLSPLLVCSEKGLTMESYLCKIFIVKEVLYEVRCFKSTEDMILALTGQFTQLSLEPEKFR